MKNHLTVDQLIEQLTAIKERCGGDLPVAIALYNGDKIAFDKPRLSIKQANNLMVTHADEQGTPSYLYNGSTLVIQ